jgi:hypothetical protein
LPGVIDNLVLRTATPEDLPAPTPSRCSTTRPCAGSKFCTGNVDVLRPVAEAPAAVLSRDLAHPAALVVV